MQIAFYAPLKAPDHPDPSGDRTVARLLLQALERAGVQALLASRFRTRLQSDSLNEQQDLATQGQAIAEDLIAQYKRISRESRPQAWFTYHLYYKAVDWIGPSVAAALDIPYLVAEASHAPKRATGSFAFSHAAAEMAIRQAAAIFCLNPADKECLRNITSATKLVDLRPFLDIDAFLGEVSERPTRTLARLKLSQQHRLDLNKPWLVVVAMMRPGDKLASYKALAQALKLLSREYELLIVGDGPARREVEAAFAFLAERVTWLGQKSVNELPEVYASADLCVWPAINEAFGMALLEAQACGTPVIAGASGGVSAMIVHSQTGWLSAPGDINAFAANINLALSQDLSPMRLAISAHTKKYHDITTAAQILYQTIAKITHKQVMT